MIPVTQQSLDVLESGAFIKRVLILAELQEGPYGVWNDHHDIQINGQQYHGLLNFTLSEIIGDSSGSVEGATLEFSRLDADATALIDAGVWHQKQIKIQHLYIDPNTKQVLFIRPVFSGRIDAAIQKTSGDGTAVLQLSLEGFDRDLNRSVGGVRSNADQARIDPTDKFFEYVAATSQDKLAWGRA